MAKQSKTKERTIKERVDKLKSLQINYNKRTDRQIKDLQEECGKNGHEKIYDPLHKFHKCVCCGWIEFDNVNQEILQKYWKNS